jgi:hypothetical protein
MWLLNVDVSVKRSGNPNLHHSVMMGGKTNNMYIKHPRTFHLPWSLGRTSDDKTLSDTSCFIVKQVIIPEKMDGEKTTLYRDYFHARSLDGRDHPSRSWIKQFHATFKHEIPEGYRICGENLYAKHSIGYDNLKSYFYCFSIWDETNTCLSWKDTVEYCQYLGIETVPVLKEPFFWNKFTPHLMDDNDFIGFNPETSEGYVVRNSDSFPYSEFKNNVAKFVRKNHVQTSSHWMHSEVVPNKLIKIEV